MPRIVLFGDSLTQYSFDPEGGWGAALAHRFQRRADVVNRGFSGYNTRIVQRELPRHVLPLVDVDTLLTTVFLGANDAAIPPAHQHVPLDEFRTNLTAIVLEIQKKNPSGKVLVITPPPIYRAGRIAFQRARDDIAADQPDPTPDRDSETTARYAAVALEVAAAQGVHALDLFSRVQQVNPERWGEDYLGTDGLHFTAEGQRAVGRLVLEAIERDVLGKTAEELPMNAPWWGELYGLPGPK